MRKTLIILIFITSFLFSIRPVLAYWEGDTDGDLMTDSYESAHNLNPNDPSDADQDLDNDQLINLDEFFANTDPHLNNVEGSAIYNDNVFLNILEGHAFRFFWDHARPPYYFVPDNADNLANGSYSNNFNSILGIGDSLLAYVVADYRGWMDHEVAYNRIKTILSRLVALQDPSYDKVGSAIPNSQKGNRHGYLYHFVANDGTRSGTSEISTVDHGLFVAAALIAGEYYKGTEVEQFAHQLFLNTDWNWLWNGQFLYQGWLEQNGGPYEGGITLDLWNRYAEEHALLILAMAATFQDANKGIPLNAWANLGGFPYEVRTLQPGNFGYLPWFGGNPVTYIHAGSLHTHQYSHVLIDFRKRPDGFGKNYFDNSVIATLVNRQYCLDLKLAYPTTFETYETNVWGLSAGIRSDGYNVNQPIVPPDDLSLANIAQNNDSGTVFPFAHLGSMAFTPTESLAMSRTLYARWFAHTSRDTDLLWNRYGFLNAFNAGQPLAGAGPWYMTRVIAIDLGPIVGMMENYRTGLLWRLFMRNSYVQQGLQAAGFNPGIVEPFILNFDSNPPLPSEDPNGGGQDPNSFGGFMGSYGNGASVSYVNLGDPFPGQDYGPQQYAAKISTTESHTGAYITLNNHSVSRWGRISFWIRGETGGEQVGIALKDNPTTQQTEFRVPISTFLTSGITNQWQEVRIPLQVFIDGGVRLTSIDNLSFEFINGSGTIYVDDIAFLDDEQAPSAPQVYLAQRQNTENTIAWLAPNEKDVVGYNIYRSVNGGSYVKLNSTLIVTLSYSDQDQISLQNSYSYRVEAVDNATTSNVSPQSQVDLAPVTAPTVQLQLSTTEPTAGQSFSLTLSATSPIGLSNAWWFVVDPSNLDNHNIPGKVNGNSVNLWQAQDFSAVPIGANQASYNRTVSITNPGNYLIKANARDIQYPVPGEEHQASEGLGLAVVPVVNHAPVFITTQFPTLKANQKVSMVLQVQDPDKDPIQVKVKHLPAFASFNSKNLTFTFQPTRKDQGKYTIQITLSDEKGGANSQKFVLNVVKKA